MKTVAFAGNPNTGKSSWINKLAQSRLSTGNWNGVTVEKTEAVMIWKHQELHLIDLPGINGFHHQSDEEKITEEFLHHQPIDCIVMVMDACHFKSSLRLCLDIRDLQVPMVCLINFKDEAIKNGIHIETQKISKRLSIPVIYGSTMDDENREELLDVILQQTFHTVQYRPLLNPEADRIFTQISRFHSLKEAITLFHTQYPELALQEREAVIESCMKFCIGNLEKAIKRTLLIDQWILKRGKAVFLSVVLSSFFLLLVCGLKLSELSQNLFDMLFAWCLPWLECLLPEIVTIYAKDVVVSGIGTLIGFVPLLFLLHFFQAVLQESGLMARISLLMDHWMRMFHLTGKSFLCFVTAYGCNVPAVIHSTALETESIRKKTALLVSFCCCSARFAVLISFTQLIFKKHTGLILWIGYSVGMFLILVLSLLMNQKKAYQCPKRQIMELPVYRAVQWKILFRKSFQQCNQYIRKIVHLLLLVMTVLWLMMKLELNDCSFYELICRIISVIYLPLGFGKYWIYTASILPGLLAKEASIGSLMMLQAASGMKLSPDPAVNVSYLVYLLTTIPCIMTLQALKQHYGKRFACQSAALSFAASYLLTWILYQFIILF